MTNIPLQIARTGADAVEMRDDTGRVLRLHAPSWRDPLHVEVPAAAPWQAQQPAWAQVLRDAIVQRLRDDGWVVVERDGNRISVQAADGSCRVEQAIDEDERFGPWAITRFIQPPDQHPLLELFSRTGDGRLGFPGPGLIELSLGDRQCQPRLVRIDTRHRSFQLPPGGPDQPLDHLSAALGMVDPSAPAVSAPARRGLQRLLSALNLLGSAVMASGGVWMGLTAGTGHDRWIGLAGALFFGLCGATFWHDVFPRR